MPGAQTTVLNLPTMITLLRIILIPVFVGVFYLEAWWANPLAAAIFLIASLTDFLDGYLARRLNQTTRFGAFLDPVADKLMVAAALVLLVEYHATPWLVLPATLIILREITISALREWMAQVGAHASVSVLTIGKWKTGVQMTAMTLLLGYSPDFVDGRLQFTAWLVFNYALLYLATALTLWSMAIYLKAAWPHLHGREE